MEGIKKTKVGGIMGVLNLLKWSGTTDSSIINRVLEMEEIFSGIEDTKGILGISDKENVKSKTK